MPKTSFKKSRSWKKKPFTSKKFKVKKSKTYINTSTVSSVTPTVLKNVGSLISRQPVPDRYETWITTDTAGYWSANVVNSATFGFSLDTVLGPFANAGFVGTTLPHPLVTPSGTAVKNILYNATTSTGLYTNYRVWRAKVVIQVVPQVSTDAALIAAAPIVGTAGDYGNVPAISAGINAASTQVTQGASGSANSISFDLSVPELLGIKKTDYGTTSTAHTSSYTGGIFMQVGYSTVDGANNSQPISIFIRLQQYVEFFQRVDWATLQ